jgi:carboxypeptidase C (cathepsin A)
MTEIAVKTHHSVEIMGEQIDYTATAGRIVLHDAQDKPTAAIFYIAYTRDRINDLTKRPITFAFNGGPGSSSVWLHLGLLGPRRVHLKEDGTPYPPPYRLVDNQYSLLDVSDLVFIDPVSTGFSRAAKPEEARQFHGVEGDIRSVADFIRLYTTRNLRWDSPKFIIGESYGTTRAAGLSGELHNHLLMNVNGIILVSTVLNFETISFASGNDLPYILYLPTYTAVAWYHHKLPPDLQDLSLDEVIRQSKNFAQKDYNDALLRGDALTPDQRHAIAKQLARFTGLPQRYIERASLRVPLSRFAARLLRDQNRVIGRYDGRYTGYIRDALAGHMEYDPSYDAVASVFASTFNDYVRRELNYKSNLPYEILTNVGPWDWGRPMGYLNVADVLADSLTRDPFLRVDIASGRYDLATPWFSVRYTLDHLRLNPALRKNITLDTYNAGHMMYLNTPDLKKLRANISRFIRQASGQN